MLVGTTFGFNHELYFFIFYQSAATQWMTIKCFPEVQS